MSETTYRFVHWKGNAQQPINSLRYNQRQDPGGVEMWGINHWRLHEIYLFV